MAAPGYEENSSLSRAAAEARDRPTSAYKRLVVRMPTADGWQVYDEETEFVRLGIIRPKSLDT